MPSHLENSDDEARRIGQAMLDLSARLPDQWIDVGTGEKGQAQFYVSYDAADEVWEIEWCPLDFNRNRGMQDRDLLAVLERTLEIDREKAPDV